MRSQWRLPRWRPGPRDLISICIVIVIAGSGLYFVWRGLELGPARGGTVVLATGVRDGGYYRLGEELRRALGDKLGVEVRVTAGSRENIALLKSGKATFAFIQGGPDMGQQDLVALAVLEREYGHLIVPADSPVRSSLDLAGKRVALGSPQSGSHALGEALIDHARFQPGPTITDTPFTVADLEGAFTSGSIDAAFMVFELHAPLVETLLGTGRYRLVPLHSAYAVERLVPGTFAEIIPHSFYGPNRSIPGQAEGTVETVAVSALLVTRRQASSHLVRTILETVYSIPFTRDARLHRLVEEDGRRVRDLPLHPAAQEFYDRKSPVTSDKFEIASFFLAGLICLVSATHFAIGWWHRRREERRRRHIVVFFEELLKCGTMVEKSSCIDELTNTLHEMMAAQRRAEKEWLHGELRTEDMDNLYTLYGVRSRNAFHKIFQIQNRGLAASLRDLDDRLAALEKRAPGTPRETAGDG